MISFLFPFHSRAAHDYTRDTTKKKRKQKKNMYWSNDDTKKKRLREK